MSRLNHANVAVSFEVIPVTVAVCNPHILQSSSPGNDDVSANWMCMRACMHVCLCTEHLRGPPPFPEPFYSCRLYSFVVCMYCHLLSNQKEYASISDLRIGLLLLPSGSSTREVGFSWANVCVCRVAKERNKKKQNESQKMCDGR